MLEGLEIEQYIPSHKEEERLVSIQNSLIVFAERYPELFAADKYSAVVIDEIGGNLIGEILHACFISIYKNTSPDLLHVSGNQFCPYTEDEAKNYKILPGNSRHVLLVTEWIG
jgi:hypothetical protein